MPTFMFWGIVSHFLFLHFGPSNEIAKIVKGERRGKRKTKFSSLTEPSRILFLQHAKIRKGERKGKGEQSFQLFFISNYCYLQLKSISSPTIPPHRGAGGETPSHHTPVQYPKEIQRGVCKKRTFLGLFAFAIPVSIQKGTKLPQKRGIRPGRFVFSGIFFYFSFL